MVQVEQFVYPATGGGVLAAVQFALSSGAGASARPDGLTAPQRTHLRDFLVQVGCCCGEACPAVQVNCTPVFLLNVLLGLCIAH